MDNRLLVIDDEEAICEILKYNLQKEGYQVDTAYSAEAALETDLTAYELFIVDVMMDHISGFEFAKQLRKSPDICDAPIIFCTALTGEDDTVLGLNIGADDYITKPFKINELIARVNAVIRRTRISRRASKIIGSNTFTENSEEITTQPHLVYKSLHLDPNEKVVSIDGTKIPLTKTEFDLLAFLLARRNRIFSREEIISNVWTGDVVVTNRTIDTNITRLRKKLAAYGNNIQTRQGFGYGFKETD